MDMPGLRARPALTDALLQSHRDLTDLIFGRGGGATRPHRPGWGSRTTAPHDGPSVVRSNRLLFALGERKQASRPLHGAQHNYTPCKRTNTKKSDAAIAASSWPKARPGKWSSNAPAAGLSPSCGPSAPTPSRRTASAGVVIADSRQPVQWGRVM